MNNLKKNVLACLTLALCSLSSVEAISKRKDADVIAVVGSPVGTWNFTLDSTVGGVTSTSYGEANFHSDNTVEFFTTGADGVLHASAGIWEPVSGSTNSFNVRLSDILVDATPTPVSRLVADLIFTIISNGCQQKATITGDISTTLLVDNCICLTLTPFGTVTGTACQLTF